MNPPLQAGTIVGRARAFFERRPAAAFLIILAVGLLARVVMLPGAGFAIDLDQHYHWASCGLRDGVFHIYTCEVAPTHPPISPTLLTLSLGALRALGGDISYFDGNGAVVAALKMPNLLFETALICLFFYVAYKKAGVWWASAATAALYWNPGWAVSTAWWGQNDAVYSFFMLLAAYLLTRSRPRWMWIACACAGLGKFQAITFLPVLGIFSLRRFGWRATLEGGLLGLGLLGLVVLPFFLGSGTDALRPFVGTVSLFANISNGGNTFWWLISGASPTALSDGLKLVGGLSYFQAGLIALALGTALLCLRVGLLPRRADEYFVLMVASFSFYILPTQVGIRYFYPGVVFLALAMIRDRRMIAVYALVALVFTHNIFETVWLGIGLLYYPSRLLFWPPEVDAVVMTALYVFCMILFLQPLFRRNAAAQPASEAR